MNFYPVNIDYPFNIEMILLEEYPENIFTPPFMFQGIQDYVSKKGKARKKIMPLNEYVEYINEQDCLLPTGFIYHPSRCGSTLISQMLAQLDQCRVISEPNIPNSYLKHIAAFKQGKVDLAVLRAIILGLVQKEDSPLKHTFIKFSSWFTYLLPYVRQAFPKTPWLYIFRNPFEILVSNLEKPTKINEFYKEPTKIKLNNLLINKSKEELYNLSELTYWGYLTEKNFCIALENLVDKSGLAVDYENIKEVFLERIIGHFGIKPNNIEVSRILKRSRFYSKTRNNKKFKLDRMSKQNKITKKMRKELETIPLEQLFSKLKNS